MTQDIQADRTSQWDYHDSTELIEERGANWLNDAQFSDYENDDDSLFGRGDDYYERCMAENARLNDEQIEEYEEE